MHRFVVVFLFLFSVSSSLLSACSSGENLGGATWRQSAELGKQEIEEGAHGSRLAEQKQHFEKAQRILEKALDQLLQSNDKVAENDPELEKLMLYYIPDSLAIHLQLDSMQPLLNKKLVVCQKLFGENSIPTADALSDMSLYAGMHNRDIYKHFMQESRAVTQALLRENKPYTRSDWHEKKEVHYEERTGVKRVVPSYSIATQDISKGTLISKQNIKEVFLEYPHPKGALGGCSGMYGCRTLMPISKDQPITKFALCAHPGPLLWEKISPSEPKWIQCGKAAMMAQQKQDYASAIRLDEECVAELDKVAKSGKKLEDYCERCYLSAMLSHDMCLESLNKPQIPGKNLNPLIDDFEKRAATELKNYDLELDWHKRYLAVLSKLIPDDCCEVVGEKDRLNKIPERIQFTQKWLADMRKAHSSIKQNIDLLNPLSPNKSSEN